MFGGNNPKGPEGSRGHEAEIDKRLEMENLQDAGRNVSSDILTLLRKWDKDNPTKERWEKISNKINNELLDNFQKRNELIGDKLKQYVRQEINKELEEKSSEDQDIVQQVHEYTKQVSRYDLKQAVIALGGDLVSIEDSVIVLQSVMGEDDLDSEKVIDPEKIKNKILEIMSNVEDYRVVMNFVRNVNAIKRASNRGGIDNDFYTPSVIELDRVFGNDELFEKFGLDKVVDSKLGDDFEKYKTKNFTGYLEYVSNIFGNTDQEELDMENINMIDFSELFYILRNFDVEDRDADNDLIRASELKADVTEFLENNIERIIKTMISNSNMRETIKEGGSLDLEPNTLNRALAILNNAQSLDFIDDSFAAEIKKIILDSKK